MRLLIRDLDTPAAIRHYHHIESAFHKSTDGELALKHLMAVTSMPDASWGDWLFVGEQYGRMGRHREAVEIYRRIMPDLIALPRGNILKECGRHGGCHFRQVARSFASIGDITTAGKLLREEGQTPDVISQQRSSKSSALPPNAPSDGASLANQWAGRQELHSPSSTATHRSSTSHCNPPTSR